MIEKLIAWGKEQALVRAMVLTSSRAVPNNPYVDAFSDYDVILALRDVQPFHDNRDWLTAFGTVLAMYRDPLYETDGLKWSANVVQFMDGLKIDFTLWPVEQLQIVAGQETLPPEFDAGYQVLLDKDGLTEGIKPPCYRGYIPQPPTETRYHEEIENFFLCATYVAKYLLRDDVMAAKFLLDGEMKHENLLPILEWLIEIDNDWGVKPGNYGRRLKKWLRSDLWNDLENTYTGMEIEKNWQALFRLIDLMHKAGVEAGEKLGFTYPESIERQTRVYLESMKNSRGLNPTEETG
ncbi:MAG: aminoglycoside 6-adenylyltransferase [Chloroflexi bacterium]|nr:aminoglycoside 6-adenylyltransferase [Chloroflexota bacterium]